MKRLAITFFVLSSVGCSGFGAFDIDRNIPEQVVQGSALGGVLNVFGVGIPVDVNLEQETESRNAGPVKSVKLTRLVLNVTETSQSGAGDEDNFDFLDSIEITMSSSQSGSSLPPVVVALVNPVPEGVTSLEFETTGENIKAYVEEGAVLDASVTGEEPPDDVSFDGRLTITVDVI